MADIQKIIEIVFQGTDQASSTFTTVGAGLNSLDQSIGDVTGPLADVTDFILKIDTALLALGATMIGFAVNEAGKFQTATSEINTLLDATPEQFAALQDAILDYSRESVSSLDQVNSAVYSAISAGTDYKDALGVVSAAEQLAVAGRAQLDSTTTLLVSTMNAYGASADEAGKYSDILFETVRQGQTTIPELSSSLAQVTGLASSAGVPFADLSAAIADLTAKGLPTSQAITGIKAALSNIIKPSTDAKAAAQELGIAFDLNALQTQGLDGLLRTLAEATGGNVDEMGRFFGSVEGLNSALSLSNNKTATFSARLDAVRGSAGATGEAYEKMAESFDNVNQNLVNNLQATLIIVGVDLLDEYRDVAEALGNVFAAVGEGVDDGAFDPVFSLLEQFSADVEAFLSDLARNLPEALELIDWSGFTGAMRTLAESVAGLFDGADVSTPQGLADAIQGLVDTGGSLIDLTAGIVDGFKPFIDGLIDAIEQFNELEDGTKNAAGEILGIGKAVNVLLPAVGTLGVGLETIGFGLTAIAGASTLKTITALGAGFSGIAATAGLVAASLGSVVFAFSTMSAALDDYLARNEAYRDTSENLTEIEAERARRLDEISQALGLTIPNMDEFNRLVAEGKIVFDEATGTWRNAAEALDEHGEAAGITADELDAMIAAEANLGGAVVDTSEALGDAAGTTQTLDTKTSALVRVIKDAEGNIIGYEQKTRAKTSAQDADTKSVQEITKASEKYRLELEKIASDERIKNIEARVTLEVAELEANTEIVKASFESIDTAITSTGDLLASLFGSLAEAGSLREKFLIEEQIERENELREEALDLQRELVDIQIEYLRAKTDSLNRGDALISISGDGLEPELEAFMWRIIERVQVQASNEGAELLLGLA